VALFAARGVDGVSMRDVARQVGLSAPTLYHHFPDKQSLYLAAVARAFAATEQGLVEALARELPPEERLNHLVYTFTRLTARDETFRKLLLRELLDGDEERLALIARQVFGRLHGMMIHTAREFAGDLDPYLLLNSMVGMVLFAIQSVPLRRHFPGEGRARTRPAEIAEHVCKVISRASRAGGAA
jgi:AcrR family transcriptional regulator